MSIFSSWGDVNLKLKPEITSPGGDVWSSYPYADAESDKYVLMSGTSMASPNTAGSTVVVKQYVREVLGVVDPVEANTLTYQLLMGTATVVANEDGQIYSPRKQGAGLVNLAAATSTKQYITVDGTDRVKLELGKDASKTGVYEMTFNLVNIDKNNPADFDISTLVMGLDTNSGLSLEEFDCILSDSLVDYSVTGDGALAGSVVTVNANGTVKVKVTVTLSQSDKELYDLCFKYGTYIEGFVTLTGDVTLSVPFLAFYGDYDASPAFDIAPWEEVMDFGQDFVSKDGLTITSIYLQNGKFYQVDQSSLYEDYFNFKTGFGPAPFDGTFCINGAVNQNSYMGSMYGIYSYQFSMLKNVDYQEFSIYDKATGENLLPFDYNYFLRQSCFLPEYSAFNSYTYSNLYQYMAQFMADYMKNNMEFEFVMDAEWTGSDGLTYSDSQSINVFVDQELSTMLDHKITQEGDKYYLEVTYWDNYAVQAICLYDADFNSYFDVASTATEKNQVVTQKIDITDFYSDAATNGGFYVGFVDYAYNENYYVVEIGAEAEPSSYALNQNNVNVVNTGGTPDPTAPEFVVNEYNVLTAYNGKGGNVVIPDGVVAIANNVFARNTTVGSVTLPASLKRIGENAFNNCPNLRYVICQGDSVPVLVGGTFTEDGYLAYTTFTNSTTEFVSPSGETKSIGNIKFVMLKDIKTNPSYELFVSQDVLTKEYVKDFNTNLPQTYEVGAHWMVDFTDKLAGFLPTGTFAPDELVVYNADDLDVAKVQEEINSCKDYTTLTLADKEKVEKAKVDYEYLSAEQKALINEAFYIEIALKYISMLETVKEGEDIKVAASEVSNTATETKNAAGEAQNAVTEATPAYEEAKAAYEEAKVAYEEAKQAQEEAQGACDIASQDLENANADLSSANDQLSAVINNPDSTPEEIEAAEKALAAAQNKVNEAQTTLTNCQNKLTEADDNVNAKNAVYVEFKDKYEVQEAKYVSLQAKADALKAQAEALQAKADALNALADAKAVLAENEAVRIESELAQIFADIAKNNAETAQAAAEAAQALAEAAKTEADALKSQADAAQVAAEAAQTAAETAEANADATEAEVTQLKVAAEAAKTEAENLRTQALAAQVAAEVARNEANTLKAQAEVAKAEAEAAKNAADSDKTATTDAQAKAEAAQAAAEAALKAATAKANTAQVCMVVSIVFMVLTIAGGAVLIFVKFKKAN